MLEGAFATGGGDSASAWRYGNCCVPVDVSLPNDSREVLASGRADVDAENPREDMEVTSKGGRGHGGDDLAKRRRLRLVRRSRIYPNRGGNSYYSVTETIEQGASSLYRTANVAPSAPT